MSRSITIRTRIAFTVAGAGAAALVTGLLVSSPSYAAPPPGTDPTATALPSSTTSTTSRSAGGSGTTVATSSSRPSGGSGWSDYPTSGSTSTSPCYTYTMVGAAPGQVLQSWDFEYGTTQGWTATGASVAVSDAAAASGTHSLAVTGFGAGTDLTATVGGTGNLDWYSVTANVRLAPGQSAQWLRLRADTGSGATSLPGYVRATGDGWAQVTAWYYPQETTLPNACYPMTVGASTPLHLTLAAATCGQAATNLYLDDVKVTRRASGQTGTPTTAAGPTSAGCTSPTTPVTCTVSYTVGSQWSGGFQAGIVVTNPTDQTLSGWKLRWTFTAGEQVSTLWGASTWAQSGTTVSVTGADWAPLRPGGTATVGFLGSARGRAGTPQGITLNGSSCTLGA